MTEIKTNWFYYVGRWLMILCLRLLTNWEVKGKENVPDKGPLLVVSNHLNNADPPLLAVSIHRKTVYMAKQELFKNPIIRYFISGFGGFPVNRFTADRNALKLAKTALENGLCLVMFPEGMRSRTAMMNQAFPGSALIATQNNVTILPVGISGTEKMSNLTWIFRRPRIMVTIGKTFTIHTANGYVTREELVSLTDELMLRITELIPAKYHGVYAEKAAQRENQKVR
jgi:1-acyl-sn-glycerol-3-phosphate acyltransferase